MDFPDLRPLSFGELLDRTFTYYRHHFWLFAGIMAVPQVIIIALGTLWQELVRADLQTAAGRPPVLSTTYDVRVFGSLIVVVVVYFSLYAVALGAATFAVSEIHLGRRVTARQAYSSLRGRLWRLADLIATIGIREVLFFFLLMVTFVVATGMLTVLIRPLGALGAVAFGFLMIVALLGGAVFGIWFFLRYGCAVPALLLENIKAGRAIKRSIKLTRKNVGRVFLITVLMSLISSTAAALLEGPFLLGMMFMTFKSHLQPPVWLELAMRIAGGAGHVATGALLMIGLVLLYYDLRVRKEGFDLQVMMSALDSPTPLAGAGPASSSPSEPDLEKTNVASLVLLTVLTLGLYYPLWFLRRRQGINSLKSREKLGVFVFVLVSLLWLLVLCLNLGFDYIHLPGGDISLMGMRVFDIFSALVLFVVMLVQLFKVRRILEAHAAESSVGPLGSSLALIQGASLSAVATWFFGIFYLQHKINELVDTWTQGRSELGSDILPAM